MDLVKKVWEENKSKLNFKYTDAMKQAKLLYKGGSEPPVTVKKEEPVTVPATVTNTDTVNKEPVTATVTDTVNKEPVTPVIGGAKKTKKTKKTRSKKTKKTKKTKTKKTKTKKTKKTKKSKKTKTSKK